MLRHQPVVLILMSVSCKQITAMLQQLVPTQLEASLAPVTEATSELELIVPLPLTVPLRLVTLTRPARPTPPARATRAHVTRDTSEMVPRANTIALLATTTASTHNLNTARVLRTARVFLSSLAFSVSVIKDSWEMERLVSM
jgi:hypothetical protein